MKRTRVKVCGITRVEDALAATRAAVDEGIIPGGGMALRRISIEHLDVDIENADQDSGDLSGLDKGGWPAGGPLGSTPAEARGSPRKRAEARGNSVGNLRKRNA